MRFEELAYSVDGLPVTVDFHARLTVISLPQGDERAEWIGRLLGVLEGMRPGDGAGLAYFDHRGRRVRLQRDEQGAATLTDLATGGEIAYSAAHLSLDGRFDWFASVGMSARKAMDLILVDASEFARDGEDYDRRHDEARLAKARALLARIETRRQAARIRARHRDELLRRITELEEGIAEQLSAPPGEQAPPGTPPGGYAAAPVAVLAELDVLAATWCALAGRRDELIAKLDTSGDTAGDGENDVLRELTEEVEPAYADGLLAFAEACRPYGVVLDAARIEAAGVGAAGVAALTAGMVAEVAGMVDLADDGDAGAAADAEAEGGDAEAVADAAGDAEAEGGAFLVAEDPEAEREALIDEVQRVERGLPDEADLARRRAGLERCIATVEASLNAGRSLAGAAEAEAILVRRAGRARRVGRHREPLPLVVDDAFRPFSSGDKRTLLDVLRRLGETTQIVYLTDDPEVLAWASRSAGAGEAALWQPEGIATVA